jgi:hypothetical protein
MILLSILSIAITKLLPVDPLAPFHHASQPRGESQEGEVKLSFKDRHHREVSKENAEVVEVEYYDRGALKWRGNAVVHIEEPESYKSGSKDCVMVECRTEGCPWNGKQGSVHVYFDDNHKIIVLGPHTEPMCEHVWNRLKSEVDDAVRQTREYEAVKEPGPGTTYKIG